MKLKLKLISHFNFSRLLFWEKHFSAATKKSQNYTFSLAKHRGTFGNSKKVNKLVSFMMIYFPWVEAVRETYMKHNYLITKRLRHWTIQSHYFYSFSTVFQWGNVIWNEFIIRIEFLHGNWVLLPPLELRTAIDNRYGLGFPSINCYAFHITV
jgi:hypothetical protein